MTPVSRAEELLPTTGAATAVRRVTGGQARPRVPIALGVVATLTAVVFAIPVLYVLWRAVTLGSDLSDVLDEALGPMWRTIQLGALVSVATGIVGTGLAWLLVRTDVPLARMWRVVVPLPLVFPSFVGAAAFLAGLAPDGVLRSVLDLVGLDGPRRFRGLGASCLVLTAFTYPYVYLPVAARLAGLPPRLEESARLLGDGTWRMFGRVVLPALRSSMFGGMLLVFLYSLSEFGAVQLLGYDTLTRVVYATRLADRAQSFAAATLLLVLAVVAVTGERRVRGSMHDRAVVGDRRSATVSLGAWRFPALAGVGAVVGIALVVPVASLGQWAWRGVSNSDSPARQLRRELGGLGEPAWTTGWSSVVAALLAVAAVLPVALVSVRHRSRFAGVISAAVLAGFAVPGLVIALSLAFWALNVPHFDRLYQTVPLLITAYVVHFGSQAMRATEVAISAVPARLGESARLLGASRVRRAATIDLPLMCPGLLAGGGLVLLSTVKELPATLLLAPTGLETLTTRVWGAFEDGFLAEAGMAAMALVALSALLTWLLVLRRSQLLA